MAKRIFLFVPGDGTYRAANEAMVSVAADFIAKLADTFSGTEFEAVPLHPDYPFIDSLPRAQEVARRLREAGPGEGDIIACVTVHWPLPEHGGLVIRAVADLVLGGAGPTVAFISNCLPQRPGLVGQAAIVLVAENLGMTNGTHYTRHILREDSDFPGLVDRLRAASQGTLLPRLARPRDWAAELTTEHHRLAKEILRWLRENMPILGIFNSGSMTMAQGWVSKAICDRLCLTPVFIGSNEMSDLMRMAPNPTEAHQFYEELGLVFDFAGGYTNEMLYRDLRMTYAFEELRRQHNLFAWGTQGQKDTSQYVGATDFADSVCSSNPRWRFWGLDDTMARVVSTEMDFDGLVTMVLQQVIGYVMSGIWYPIGFHDVRHPVQLSEEEWVLIHLNSGAQTLDNLLRNPDNLEGIFIQTQNREIYFPPGGGCVSGEIRPHEASLNRLFLRPDCVVMQGARCGFIPVTREERLSGQYGELDQNWPFGATRLRVPVMDFMGYFVPNHSHTIPLDIQAVMAALCEELGWEYRPMGL